MTRQEKIKMIAEHYGYDRQSKQLMEEMGELAQATCKVWRANHDKDLVKVDYMDMSPYLLYAIHAMLGEYADVLIMIEQLIFLLDMEPEVMRIMDQKLDRQIKRIKEGEKWEKRLR